MKKFLLTSLILLFNLQAFGFEDYMVLSDEPVKNFYSADENIVRFIPIITISNDNKTLILKPNSIGKTYIVLETEKGKAFVDVEVTKDKTIISEIENIDFILLDKPEGGNNGPIH